MTEVYWALQINLVVSVSKLIVSIYVYTHSSVFYSTTIAIAILLQMKNNRNVKKAIEIDHFYKSDPSMRANL